MECIQASLKWPCYVIQCMHVSCDRGRWSLVSTFIPQMRLKNRQLKQQQSVQSSTGSSHLPTTPTSPITPLSAIPPEVSLSEEVSTRETAHALERTASGSPIKGSSKARSLAMCVSSSFLYFVCPNSGDEPTGVLYTFVFV